MELNKVKPDTANKTLSDKQPNIINGVFAYADLRYSLQAPPPQWSVKDNNCDNPEKAIVWEGKHAGAAKKACNERNFDDVEHRFIQARTYIEKIKGQMTNLYAGVSSTTDEYAQEQCALRLESMNMTLQVFEQIAKRLEEQMSEMSEFMLARRDAKYRE